MYYDTVCQFSCNNGYIGSGSQVRRCQTMELGVDKISLAKVRSLTLRYNCYSKQCNYKKRAFNDGYNLIMSLHLQFSTQYKMS